MTLACGRSNRHGYSAGIVAAAIVSFRLGGEDGVSIEAAKWGIALGTLGFEVFTVAGEGPVDHLLDGLAIGAAEPPTDSEIANALDSADLVVVENLCSLPLNPRSAEAVARVLSGRPAIFRHHDLAWQRERFAGWPPPPDDPAWRHVTINDLSRRELADRGIAATTIHNAFDPSPPPGDRIGMRDALGIREQDRLLLQPTRALERKNIPGGVELSEALGAAYWLLGPPEDGYGPELEQIVARAGVKVLLGMPPTGEAGLACFSIHDAYAASDAVVLPSTWEGFGNPAIESAMHSRPLAIGLYPVARELASFGFRWFGLGDVAALSAFMEKPDRDLLFRNKLIGRRHFSTSNLADKLERLIQDAKWGSGERVQM
ncbi:MAG: glycosyltransferase family 4 protein [Acidimicrobiales bacterium]